MYKGNITYPSTSLPTCSMSAATISPCWSWIIVAGEPCFNCKFVNVVVTLVCLGCLYKKTYGRVLRARIVQDVLLANKRSAEIVELLQRMVPRW